MTADQSDSLARYDYRGLGQMLKQRLAEVGPAKCVCSDEIGVSASDLSLIMCGQPIPAARIIAICDWLKVSFRAFYTAAPQAIAQREAPNLFGKTRETKRTSHG